MVISRENVFWLTSITTSASSTICVGENPFYVGLAMFSTLGLVGIALYRNYQNSKIISNKNKMKLHQKNFDNRVEELQGIIAERQRLLIELKEAEEKNQLHRAYRLRNKISKLD